MSTGVPDSSSSPSSSSSSSSSSKRLFVVAVDSREEGVPGGLAGYSDETCDATYFHDKIVNHPKMHCVASSVAALCGMDIKLYFMKANKGMNQYYREGGPEAVTRFIQNDPGFLSDNNGIASLLTMDPVSGLAEWIVTGKAYVVWNDGQGPLSKGQVWGLQEMVTCSMGIYDFEPANMRAGHAKLQRWARQFQAGTWMPPSGLGGVDIYSGRGGTSQE